MSSVSRHPGHLIFAAACLSGIIAGPGLAAEAPAPGQIVGYAKADRSGASQAWELPPDKPYLYVPSLPAALGGRIATVETGPEVGVALFQDPYFTTRDRGCQPALGTPRQPHLAWLGATARFAPAPPGQPKETPPGPSNAPAAGAAKDIGGYRSLILYRTDLGPPPGALLLDRRATVGLRCANPAYKTVYNRIFVPMAEAPQAERCFDLVGNYPSASGTFQLDFLGSDRLTLLMPGDMAERYAAIRHDITVTLFDGLSCQGAAISLDSRARIGRDVRLSELNFRDRARSMRVSYDYGNADAFLVRKPAPPAVPAPAAPTAPTAAKGSEAGTATSTASPADRPQAPAAEVLAARPIDDPAIGGATQDTTEVPKPPAAKHPAKAASKEPASPAAKAVTPKPAPAATAAPRKTPVAARTATPADAPVKPPVAAPAKAPVAAPAEPAPKPLAQAPAKAAPKAAAPQVAVGEPIPDRPAGGRLTTAPTVHTMPKLSPVMRSPDAQVAALPNAPQTFQFPVHNLYRLSHCLYWQRECGQAAATAWCQTKGFGQAIDWSIDRNIGATFPTYFLGDQQVCAQFVCDGFKEITCGP